MEAKKRRRINRCGRLKGKIFSWACIVPSLVGVLVFFVIPFGIVIYYSLINNTHECRFVGTENFRKLFVNDAFRTACKNTAEFSLISVPLTTVFSLVLATMFERNIAGKSALRTFLLSPLVIPTASVVLVWQVLFHNHGTINSIIEFFGGTGVDWLKSKYGQVVIITMFLWKNSGYNMILFTSALAGVPRDLLEVAELEGAGKIYQFMHIKLRYISPTILFVLIMSLINSFKIFREVYLLTGDYPEQLYMLQHFMNNTFNNLNYQKLSSAAVVFAVVIALIMAVLLILENHFGKDVEG